MYFNYFDFLHNAVGIKRAANVYFNKEPRKLTVTEAAMLVGLCKNPSMFNPLRYPERCKQRRNVVLMQMLSLVMLRRLNTTSCHNVHWAYTSLKQSLLAVRPTISRHIFDSI